MTGPGAPRVTAVLAMLGGLAGLVGSARPAAVRGEQALSLELGWASHAEPDPAKPDRTVGSAAGASLGVVYEYVLTDEISLRGELLGAGFPGVPGGWLTLGTVGLTYRFDVLKYVPYGYAEAGGLFGFGGELDGTQQATVTIGAGLDVLRSRTRSWGVFGALSSFAGDVTLFQLGFRGTTRWGFF